MSNPDVYAFKRVCENCIQFNMKSYQNNDFSKFQNLACFFFLLLFKPDTRHKMQLARVREKAIQTDRRTNSLLEMRRRIRKFLFKRNKCRSFTIVRRKVKHSFSKKPGLIVQCRVLLIHQLDANS